MNRIAEWFIKNTPECDKLGHYYFGDMIWSNVGFLPALLLSFSINSYWLVLLPILSTIIPAIIKEKYDSEGYGNSDFKDVIYTCLPMVIKVFVLIIIISECQ